ncbi:hypothetical protein CRG98_047184 [Punica granatum]|uniref:Uncharacterized protein n=1 Tax=Punica granatum TaxID=22663 RepID=A0A2I0HL81_PUNGR|nr:hypothetical protein CRG98_047184 [Punica granatum]
MESSITTEKMRVESKIERREGRRGERGEVTISSHGLPTGDTWRALGLVKDAAKGTASFRTRAWGKPNDGITPAVSFHCAAEDSGATSA